MELSKKEFKDELNEVLTYANMKVDSVQLRIVNASATTKNDLMHTLADIMREKELIENKLQEIEKQPTDWVKEIENARELIKTSKTRIDRLTTNIQNPNT